MPSSPPRKKRTAEERNVMAYDKMKCDARIWVAGYDNIQCNYSKNVGGCFCKRHHIASAGDNGDGGWWLGKITEPRPEEPVGPPGSKNPSLHAWNTDKEGKARPRGTWGNVGFRQRMAEIKRINESRIDRGPSRTIDYHMWAKPRAGPCIVIRN